MSASPIQLGATTRTRGSAVLPSLLALLPVSMPLGSGALEYVLGAAIRAEHVPGLGDVEEHARVAAPQRRVGRWAMQRQVLLGDFDFARIGHGRYFLFAVFFAAGAPRPALTGESQSRCFLSLPCTRLKNAFCSSA